ncbi:DUF1788 domain-containing protein [Sulfurimonas sp. SWIR-19]|uniref:BREX protein BrxB domain-containing protein n=1 Tax=Sulfurimonas sp. SWIR-19 TaxID=2878390 RepID=UPI001CF26AB6|nr:BREX protein BrxB domain-containing protein [Sulfurimonas sp. SWIR-19]UCN01371.1 DUF1788 domain-containing protein [Sulfurimonas sp. SWIR-19]
MSYQLEYKQKFDDLDYRLNNLDELRRIANGGNSILFTYPPEDEHLYIKKAIELYQSKAHFIDIAQLLVNFIDQDGIKEFEDLYRDFINTPHELFRSKDDPITDLYDMIISEIKKAFNEGKIPIIVRTGSLYGTGIENNNIMEHKDIMNNQIPLVVFYPSKIKDDTIYFLNFKIANKYRCTVVK